MRDKKIVVMFVMCVIFILLMGLSISTSVYQAIEINKMNKNNDQIQNSFLAFHVLPPEELHVMFHRKFCDSVYVLDCRLQYNEYNCSTSILSILQDLGANINFIKENGTYMNTDEIEKMLIFHSFKIQTITGIEGKELIIFKPNKNEIPHIAWLERKNHKKRILIMEMNSRYGGINYRWIDFYDDRIKGIYPITLGFWRGEMKY